tara:strand:- start:1088 stop:1255 length:168 start_codon:yes stop_codon:yes gene_type:complete
MSNNAEMRRLSLYIGKDLVKDIQILADRERRSVSFMVADILQKAVARKNAKKSNS